MTKLGRTVHAFRLLQNSTTKATVHELQKYDIFTRYGHSKPTFRHSRGRPLLGVEPIPGSQVAVSEGDLWRLTPLIGPGAHRAGAPGSSDGFEPCAPREIARRPIAQWRDSMLAFL